MKNILFVMLCSVAIHATAQDVSIPMPELKNQLDSLNYFFGLTLGYSIETAPFETNSVLISEGLVTAVDGKSAYDAASARMMFEKLHQALSGQATETPNTSTSENMEKGAAFLAENGKKEGVFSTESGLQYEVLTMGSGPTPDAMSTVEVHYEGTLLDGTKFDSSYDRGESISFPLNRVIAGWTEGVQLMPVGSTFRFFIPSDLAYGARDTGSIPAHSVLIFKIELLGIE